MVAMAPSGTALGGARKRTKQPTASELVSAVVAVMKAELSSTAAERWRTLLDAELHRSIFRSPLAIRMLDSKPPRSSVRAVSTVMPVSRPKLTAAVLEAFVSTAALADGRPVCLSAGCIGADGGLEKLLTRRVVSWITEFKVELLQPGGELSGEKLGDKARLEKTLSRIAYDVLQFVHARASATLDDSDAVLELQSADQTLAGKPLRGCGLVYCRRGRALLERVVEEARVGLQAARGADDAASRGAQSNRVPGC